MTLDLSNVSFVCPYGAVILLDACRYLANRTGQAVRVRTIQPDVHAYLRRIDFFERAGEAVHVLDQFDPIQDFSRSSMSSSVLELAPVACSLDIYGVGTRARRILRSWLSSDAYNIDQIVNLLSEACSNVVDHSGESGVLAIRKYDRSRYVEVQLAISDLGVGIRSSLTVVHGDLSETTAGYIYRALTGLSARRYGRGGHGLGVIQRIATSSGGNLYIRSETGGVQADTTGVTRRDDLTFFPGTQLAISFRSLQMPNQNPEFAP